MNIDAINGEWFYDDVTPRGVSFDGLLPQACKIPLGNMQDFELIHTPEKMAEFQSNDWYQKNWSLADTLMTFCPLRSEESGLVKEYRKEINKLLSNPCDSGSCQHDASSDAWPTRRSCRGQQVLHQDLSLYGDMMTCNNDVDEGKFYDVKKEIYRLPDRVIAALAKCCEVKSGGIFAVLDELYEKRVISSEARDNLASASAIAIRLRLSTYLEAGKQGELLSSNSNGKTGEKALVYHMPTDEELFHFFFVAIPLYDELRQFKTSGNIPSSFANHLFFNDSDMTMGQIYCRLLKYDKAIECYERAVQENPDNLSGEIRRIRLAIFAPHNTQKLDKIRDNLDKLLEKLVKNFSQLDINVYKTTPEFTPLMNRLDMEECRQLIQGLFFAAEIYGCQKYSVLGEKIAVENITPQYNGFSREVCTLPIWVIESSIVEPVSRKKQIPKSLLFKCISFITEEGVSTKSIVWLNAVGKLLFHLSKLDMAYHCFQRAFSMERLLYGARPNVKMMTSLDFLGKIALKLKMNEESKFYFEYLVQLCESIGGIKSKLLIKETYLNLSSLSSSASEVLRYVENGLEVSTGKNERELLLDCWLYCNLAVTLYSQKSAEGAWEAVLNAQACQNSCTDELTKKGIIDKIGMTLRRMKKSKEGIELLKEGFRKLTLKSQVWEKVTYLKELGNLCLEQGLAEKAKIYFLQAINAKEKSDKYLAHDLHCRIGILKAVVLENSVSKEKLVFDKVLFSSVMKLTACGGKCVFFQHIGEIYRSIGELGYARRCYIQGLTLAKDLPASYDLSAFLNGVGKLCESISEMALARECYSEALNKYKEISNISSKLPFQEFYSEMKLGLLAKEICSILSARQHHFDRAAVILRQHVATGHVDAETVFMFLSLCEEYRAIDRNEGTRLLLESLKVSEIVYGQDKSEEMVTTLLQLLSVWYCSLGDMQNSMKYGERLIEMELQLFSSKPFLARIVTTLVRLAFFSFYTSSSKDNIERVSDFFLSSLNDKALLNTIATKTIAAKCFTFIAVLFYTSGDFEKAKSLNEKASQFFGDIQESVGTERDPCRETCDLLKTILSSEIMSPSHRTELYIYVAHACYPHRNSTLLGEKLKWFKKKYRFGGDEKPRTRELARSTKLTEEQNTLYSQLCIVHLQLDALEHYKSTGEFRQAAEIHSSLQTQQLSFYESSPFVGEEKLISEAIKAKNKNQPSKAIRLLDLALQLQLPEGQCRQTTKILKLRGECFLSMGHFRSAAIDFTKADDLHSIKTTDNCEDLCEYSEVLIGLIKSKILCNNVEAAWLVCEKGIKLVSDHELKETINQKAVKLCNLGVKCVNILFRRGEEEENKLFQARNLCQQAFRLHELILMEKVKGSEVNDFCTTILEVEFLSQNIPRKLQQKRQGENLLQEIRTSSKNIVGLLKSKILSNSNVHEEIAESLKKCGIDYLLFPRFQFIVGCLEQSVDSLNQSFVQLFSTAFPDFVLFFEKFLPLLQAITATKSSAPDQSRSPFQQAVDMCTRTLIKNQDKSSNYVNKFLTTLIITHRSLGRAQEAMAVAEIGLKLTDLMCSDSDSDQLSNRCRMLLHLAQIHQENSSNPDFNMDEELNRAEQYYLSDQDQKEDIVLSKDLSYANFLCKGRRFAEAVAVLEDIRNLDKLLQNKYVYIEYFSCAFYGAGVEKSVEMDGELLTTVENILYNLLVRAYVGIRKRKEAVATCETLTDVNSPDVHEPVYGKRPSCKPYLVEDCHRELLSLLSEKDRHQFQNYEIPLSSPNVAKLYYMLGQYEMAVKYFPKDVESPEMLEMNISCLRLAGNELIDSNRGGESIFFFHQFFEMLQVKEGFLDKPFNNQCEILQNYSFASQYYLLRSLGSMHAERENIDAAIQCYERCIELDEDFLCDQDIVATLSELYQTKALTVDLEHEDSRTAYMNLAWELFQKLFQKTAELTTFVELSYASLLTRLDRYEEAVDHFFKVIERANDISLVTFGNVDKPLVDVYLRREIEALGGRVAIQKKVLAAYELILTLMKLNKIEKAQKVAFILECVVKRYLQFPVNKVISHSVAGYAYKIIGNKEKAAEIFVSVLEKNPGHPPVIEALESVRLCSQPQEMD